MTITFDRNLANYRYYCDNDVQSLNGTSRWELRPDPEERPEGYVPQRDRPRLPPSNDDTIQYQEWVDFENGIFMGPTEGCQTPSAADDKAVLLAETYTRIRMPSPTFLLRGIPHRATVTVGPFTYPP